MLHARIHLIHLLLCDQRNLLICKKLLVWWQTKRIKLLFDLVKRRGRVTLDCALKALEHLGQKSRHQLSHKPIECLLHHLIILNKDFTEVLGVLDVLLNLVLYLFSIHCLMEVRSDDFD